MEKVYSHIVSARQKYGEKIYEMTFDQLIEEFGEETFPPWITRFDGWEEPRDEIPKNYLNKQLWQITECFCYPNSGLGYEEFLSDDEKTYFQAFSQALEYQDRSLEQASKKNM